MGPYYTRALKIVLGAHIVLIVVMCVLYGGRGCRERNRPEITLPIEFVVEVPADPDRGEEIPDVPPDPPDVPDEPDDIAPPEPDEPPPIKRERPKIEKGRRVVRGDDPPPLPTLSKEEIEKLLDMGAKPSDHTAIPSEDARCTLLVRDALLGAWVQPPRSEAGSRPAQISISLDLNGRLSARELVRSSGSASLDASAVQAAASVQRVAGLTSGFIQRHPKMTVNFEITQ